MRSLCRCPKSDRLLVSGKFETLLLSEDVWKVLNITRSPLAPLKKGGTKLLKVPLFKPEL